MIYGNDISHHQSEKAVREIAAGGKSDFIIVRATIGSYTLDMKLDIFEREGTVDKIVVDQGENKSLKPNVKYPFDIPILIHYHSQGSIGKWLSK